MGSDSASEGNKDITIKGDINVYIFGKIKNQSNDRENDDDVINYKIIKKLFYKANAKNNGFICTSNNIQYEYEYRKIEKVQNAEKKENKNYNAFLFFNNDDENFSKNLVNHLKEKDVHNTNKNVIIYFGDKKFIVDSIMEVSQESPETVPFLIVVDDIANYDEKLKYINYIPNFQSIQKSLTKKENIDENEYRKLCVKALFNYILTKLYRIDMYYNQLGYNLNRLNPFIEVNSKIKFHLTIGLVGYSGCEKSTLINLVFGELVSRVSSTATDVTTLCSEYYLPVGKLKSKNIGQIRILDFPGISEDKHYEDVVKPKILKKMKEYKKNMEQIDVALFFISNGNNRELTKSGLDLIRLLHEQKIRIIFIINGPIRPELLQSKKKN
jgi:hypothetical protein